MKFNIRHEIIVIKDNFRLAIIIPFSFSIFKVTFIAVNFHG
jgi:hypothetical protein